MDAKTFTTFVVSKSNLIERYAEKPVASTSAIPAVGELQKLQAELQNVQRDLVDRERHINEDAVLLSKWQSKGKAKEQVKSTSAATPQTNGHAQANLDQKTLNRLKRAGSANSSSTELSEPESIQSKPKKANNKKRKRGIVESDEEYSDVESAPKPPRPADMVKARNIVSSSPAPLASVPPPTFVPKTQTKNVHTNNPATPAKQQSAAPSPAPSIPPPPAIKLKLNPGQTKKDTSTPPPSARKAPVPHSQEFALPSRPLVPPRPQSVVPTPLPRRQVDVTDDFSQAKPGTQVPFSTFLGYVEPFLRNYGEDDLAYLAQKSEDLTPFLIPALGRHYSEAWAEEDSGYSGAYSSALELPPLERFRAEDLTDDKLTNESLFMGPLAERLLSAVMGDDWDVSQPASGEMDEIDMELRFQTARQSPPRSADDSAETVAISQMHQIAQNFPLDQPVPMDAVELEERIRRELRFLGVFSGDSQPSQSRDGDIDWSTRTDDEISAALRACQRQLSEQIGVNEHRKSRLSTRVRDRLARQEFESLRDGLEKTIESGWLKRQRIAVRKKAKEKENAPANPVPTPKNAKERPIPLSDALCQAIDRRRKLKAGVEPIFAEAEPGRYRGIAYESIYATEPADSPAELREA